MNHLQALIIEQNLEKAEALAEKLRTFPCFQSVFPASGANNMNSFLLLQKIDILFIRFKHWDHRLFAILLAFKKKPVVVFLSARREKFVKYSAAQVSFHLKEPYSLEAIRKLMHSINHVKLPQDNLDFFFIKHNRRYRKILFDQILAVKSRRGFLTLHTTDSKYMFAGTLIKIMQRLPEDRFCRINDSHIIPCKIIRHIENNIVHCHTGELIMTQKYKKELKQKACWILKDEEPGHINHHVKRSLMASQS